MKKIITIFLLIIGIIVAYGIYDMLNDPLRKLYNFYQNNDNYSCNYHNVCSSDETIEIEGFVYLISKSYNYETGEYSILIKNSQNGGFIYNASYSFITQNLGFKYNNEKYRYIGKYYVDTKSVSLTPFDYPINSDNVEELANFNTDLIISQSVTKKFSEIVLSIINSELEEALK